MGTKGGIRVAGAIDSARQGRLASIAGPAKPRGNTVLQPDLPEQSYPSRKADPEGVSAFEASEHARGAWGARSAPKRRWPTAPRVADLAGLAAAPAAAKRRWRLARRLTRLRRGPKLGRRAGEQSTLPCPAAALQWCSWLNLGPPRRGRAARWQRHSRQRSTIDRLARQRRAVETAQARFGKAVACAGLALPRPLDTQT